MRMRRLVVVVLALVLTGCRVDATVTVTVNSDGSGVVAVDLVADADLLAKVPSVLSDLRLDDARQAGWEVIGPSPVAGGGSSLRLTKPFHSVEQAQAVLAEVNGAHGPLREVHVARQSSFARIDVDVSGAVQWEGGVEAFSDSELDTALGHPPLQPELAALGVKPEDAFGLTVVVRLPGRIDGNGTRVDDRTMTWKPALANAARTELSAHGTQVDEGARSARRTERWARGALAVYAAAVVIGVLVLALAVLRRSQARRAAS